MTIVNNGIEAALIESVKQAEKVTSPFPILHMKNCFPADFYKRMVTHFPDGKWYRGIVYHANGLEKVKTNGISSRRAFELKPKNLLKISEEKRALWDSVREAVCSENLKKVFFERLQPEISGRLSAAEILSESVLYQDTAGFALNPHPDIPSKVVTVMFYLPEDAAQLDFGTAFYGEPSREGFGKEMKFDFSPNTGYAFVVTPKSWHGRERITDSRPRHTLLLQYSDKTLKSPGVSYVGSPHAFRIFFRGIKEKLIGKKTA